MGPAGGILRKVLREFRVEGQAVFMNTVSCWPVTEAKDGYHPTTEHKRACRGNLAAQLQHCGPYVLAMGNVAMEAMIRHASKYTRGHLVPIHGKLVMPLFHPSYIMRERDRALYRSWCEDISVFLAIRAMGMTEDPKESCIYCRNPKAPYSTATCYKHNKLWVSDQVWSQATRQRRNAPGPGQERLEI